MDESTSVDQGGFIMEQFKLHESEYRFAKIIWENEPIASGKLVVLSVKEMGWKKSTTYTVLKRLCDRETILYRLFLYTNGTRYYKHILL